jgi:hypothetical protein
MFLKVVHPFAKSTNEAVTYWIDLVGALASIISKFVCQWFGFCIAKLLLSLSETWMFEWSYNRNSIRTSKDIGWTLRLQISGSWINRISFTDTGQTRFEIFSIVLFQWDGSSVFFGSALSDKGLKLFLSAINIIVDAKVNVNHLFEELIIDLEDLPGLDFCEWRP